MKKYIAVIYSTILFATLTLLFVNCSRQKYDGNGKWIKADFHMHTTMSDGSYSPKEIAENAFNNFNLDAIALADHGGTWFKLNDDFKRIDDNENILLDGLDYELMKTPEMKRFKNQSRTIQLNNRSINEVVRLRRKYSNKLFIQGLEWNIPGHDHGCVGIISESGNEISEFHYRFDRGDIDNISKPEIEKHCESIHENSLKGIKYLEDNYPEESYFFVNHPSRSLKYTIADLRDFNNASPKIAIGFEGIPGHQKFEGNRGEYTKALSTNPAYDSRTYGGADHFLSKVGGVWDAMLGEGRKFWVFGNSDYHSTVKDYWPGEFTINYVWSMGDDYKSLIAGMKSGNIIVVQNNIISDLIFTASDENESRTMGETLEAERGNKIKIKIGYKTNTPENVHHIDLICGDITGIINPDSDEYNNPQNGSTKILKSFKRSEFSKDETELNFIEFLHTVEGSEYFRLRGSRLPQNTENETDEFGNPLCDTLVVNNEELSKSDSWFYSNPIYISIKN